MNKREAKTRALYDAAMILDSTVDGGWPEDESEQDVGRMQEAMREVSAELTRRADRRKTDPARRTKVAVPQS